MKKISAYLCGVLLVTVSLFVSCSHDVGGGGSSYTPPASNISRVFMHKFNPPEDSANTVFWEDFEGATITARNPWTYKDASLTTLSAIRTDLGSKNSNSKSWYDTLFGGEESQVIRIEDTRNDTSYLKYDNLNITEDCYLTFRYFHVAVSQSVFRVVLNGTNGTTEVFSVQGTGTSSGFTVKTVSMIIPAGTTSISFETENTNGYHFTNWPNAVFVDDITLVNDKISSIVVTPRSSQKTYVGCSDKEKFRVEAYALRADGTKVEKEVTLSSPAGTIDAKGYFTPTQAGVFKITGSCDGVTGESGEITIASKYSCEGPCTVGGVTYYGTNTDNGTLLSKQNPNYNNFNARIDFEYPATNSVTADGFVRLKGKLTPSTKEYSDLEKVVITVKSGDKETIYCCDKEFDVRVWLPFGNNHEIKICPANIEYRSYIEDGKECEGDVKYRTYWELYTINATNTRANADILAYPSWYCQADSFVVQNFTNEALYGLSQSATQEEKFKAIHDYICLNLYYDYDSIVPKGNPNRKKQDAVSSIKNKTAVCEGYANLTAAMSRYAGIKAGVVISNKLNHAWNHVWIDGTELFCDTTWDDPENDPDSEYISYSYYLLTDFNGVRNDHEASDQKIDDRHAVSKVPEIDELSELLKQGYVF